MDFTSPILHKPMYGKLEMFQPQWLGTHTDGPEVIKLEFIPKLKQPIVALYFEFETILKFYNLGALAHGLLMSLQLILVTVCPCWVSNMVNVLNF